jgi:hypothetical protein
MHHIAYRSEPPVTWRAVYAWPYCPELYSKEEQLDIEEGAGGGAASGASAEAGRLLRTSARPTLRLLLLIRASA